MIILWESKDSNLLLGMILAHIAKYIMWNHEDNPTEPVWSITCRDRKIMTKRLYYFSIFMPTCIFRGKQC